MGNTVNTEKKGFDMGNSGYAFKTLWQEATKAVGHLRDTIIGVTESHDWSDVERQRARAKSRERMVSAGKNTIPIAVVAIIAVIFLIVILNKK